MKILVFVSRVVLSCSQLVFLCFPFFGFVITAQIWSSPLFVSLSRCSDFPFVFRVICFWLGVHGVEIIPQSFFLHSVFVWVSAAGSLLNHSFLVWDF
jgi:hypothetical protein